jgi:DNA invertase Pin-like site-specific DNA recombinase
LKQELKLNAEGVFTMTTKKVVLYVRVSTDKQSVENQIDQLTSVAQRNGLEIVDTYSDAGISGAFGRDKRPAFDELLKDANRKKYDGIMVWSIDRIGRSLQDLISFLDDVQSKDIDLYIHQQGLDSSTPTGRLMFSLVGSFAEYERTLIKERVRAGMERAKKSGTKSGRAIGRPSNVNDGTKSAVVELHKSGMSMNKICKTLSIGSGTLYKLLEAA